MNEPTLDPTVFGEMRELMEEALEEFVITYLENSPQLISEMEHGLKSQNNEEVFHSAHQLKGGSSSIGAMKLTSIANTIEQISRNGSTEGIEPLLAQIKLEFDQVEKALKAEL